MRGRAMGYVQCRVKESLFLYRGGTMTPLITLVGRFSCGTGTTAFFRLPSLTAPRPRFSDTTKIAFFCSQQDSSKGIVMDKATEWTSSSNTIHTGRWYEVPHLSFRDYHIPVPLNHASTDSTHITLFVREVTETGKQEHQMPCLLFLQGGPGFESPRPSEAGAWLKRACKEFRVFLLDQRGTGLSTPLTTSSLGQFSSAQEQADYLQHFRADSIVKDAEYLRNILVPSREPWTVLGQSFGGFCAVTYLSLAPSGLKQVLLTGGLPPIGSGCTAELVYRNCFKHVIKQNKKFYNRFPDAIKKVQEIVLHLHNAGGMVDLPTGGKLSSCGLQLLGLSGLGSSGGFERLYHLLETAWDPVIVPGSQRKLSSSFLRKCENWLSFDTNPLYALMHESIYCQGAASNWAAHRVRNEFERYFDAVKAAKDGRPVFFTGEMVFPWMFDEFSALAPLKEAAAILAAKEDWPVLYDRQALNANRVPVAAVAYYEDMYVDFCISEETANEIAGARLWVTNEYMHSGLREDGERILDYLLDLLNGKKPVY